MNEKSKYRLIGISVIIAVAIVIVPSFFKKKSQEKDVKLLSIPSKDEAQKLQSEPVAKPSADNSIPIDGNSAVKLPPAPSLDKMKPVDKTPSSIPAVPAEPTPEKQKLSAATQPNLHKKSRKISATPGVGWVAQIANFADKHNANRFMNELQSRGFHTYLLVKQIKGHVHYSLVVGPAVNNRKAAERLILKVQRVLHTKEGFLIKVDSKARYTL